MSKTVALTLFVATMSALLVLGAHVEMRRKNTDQFHWVTGR